MQIGFAGNRDVAEATRRWPTACSTIMAAWRKRTCRRRFFADAIRRWPSLEDGKRDGLRKLARLVGNDDTIIQDMIDEAMRIAFTYREVFAVDQSEQSPVGRC
jgi:hypothetical protein